jgi:DNA-binding transcriptional MerR regulator
MEKHVKAYTVSQLARLAGVSVRTLHHYDQIGLLKPATQTAAGYRLYREPELLRLQQILFFKELDFPLQQIQEILDDPEFDQIRALRQHRRELEKRAERLERLLHTVNKTILKLEENSMTLTDDELYAGFTKEQAERYQRQARESYGTPRVEATEARLRKLSPAQWEAIKAEGGAVAAALAAVADRDPGDPEVQKLIARHHAWIENFYPAPADVYRGLGEHYVNHPEFNAFYEKYRPGLADFMCAAMAYYADHSL